MNDDVITRLLNISCNHEECIDERSATNVIECDTQLVSTMAQQRLSLPYG